MPETAEEKAVRESAEAVQRESAARAAGEKNTPPAPPQEITYELPDKTIVKGKSWEEIAQKTAEMKAETARSLRDREEQIRKMKQPRETREMVADPGQKKFDKAYAHELFLENPLEYQKYVNSFDATYQQVLNEVSIQSQIREIGIFHQNVPEFAGGNDDAAVLMEQLREDNLPVTAANLEAAFRSAVRAGKLVELNEEGGEEEAAPEKPEKKHGPTPRTGSSRSDASVTPDMDQWANEAPLEDLKASILRADAALRSKQ